MLYMKCPTCGQLLGDIQLEYEKKNMEIENNNKLSTEQKNAKKMELVNSFGLEKRYCCRGRLISYVSMVRLVR
jgi:DNA-directed RNA polymerase subunit N (RpoN/RPB10)